jgi:hypothetical protein
METNNRIQSLLHEILPLFCLLLLVAATPFPQNLSGVWRAGATWGKCGWSSFSRATPALAMCTKIASVPALPHFVDQFSYVKQVPKSVNPNFIKKSFGHGLARYMLWDNASYAVLIPRLTLMK